MLPVLANLGDGSLGAWAPTSYPGLSGSCDGIRDTLEDLGVTASWPLFSGPVPLLASVQVF